MEILPLWFQYPIVLVFGLIIGSFLNVCIYRFHTGRSLNGSSHCMSCGHTLTWYELFPLFSYLALRGRCKECGARIPSRYFVVELVTAGLFLWTYMSISAPLVLALSLILVSVLVMIAVYDVYHMVIPNELTLATLGIVLALFIVRTPLTELLSVSVPHLVSAFGAFTFYAGLWFVSRGRWIGFGDAKLAVPLAFLVGFPATFSMIVFSFWIGALISIVLVSFPRIMYVWNTFMTYLDQRVSNTPNEPMSSPPKSFYSNLVVAKYCRYFTMKSEVPFAPFLIIAFLLVYLSGTDVLTFLMRILS